MSRVDPICQPAADLQPARLVLSSTRGSTDLDGVWWPRTDSLHREVPFLDVAVHDSTRARIARLSYTVGAWDTEATRILTPLGVVDVGWFITSLHARDVELCLTDDRRVVVRVIAPSTPSRLAQAALRLAEEARVAIAWAGSPTLDDADRDDESASIRQVRLIEDPVERAAAAGRLEASFLRWSAQAAQVRREALDGVG